MNNKRVSLVSLGCPKNKVDAEVMLKRLADDGFIIEENLEYCDIAIINTCGFIQSAKEEAVEEIFNAVSLKEQGKIQKIVVTGCFSKRYSDEIYNDIKEVDAVLGISQYNEINKYLRKLLDDDSRIIDTETDLKIISFSDRISTTPAHRADLKIAEGCSNNCAYCAIPKIRGPYRSRDEKSIIEEAQKMIDRGVQEITLVAQDTTRYGTDLGNTDFSKLLKKLSKLDKNIWIRILYAYPEMVDEKLIDIISSSDNICNYIDIPLQHINDDILRMMNRRSDKKLIIDKYNMIKKINPDISLRTAFITGFPGETKENFKELLNFISDYPFNNVGVFAYSPEEGTTAYDMINKVSTKVAEKRRDKLMKKQMQVSYKLLSQKVGTVQKVLVEDFDDSGYWGRTQHMAADIDGIVKITSIVDLIPGEFYDCKITNNTEYDLIGEI